MTNKAKRVANLEQRTFLVICSDGPDAPALRLEHLMPHANHMATNNEQYLVAGPISSDIAGPFAGSFFLIAADTEADARDLMSKDPYIKAGVFETITVQQVVPSCGRWLGGITWDSEEAAAIAREQASRID